MMKSKDLRAKAWDSLKGKYWMAFLVALVLDFLISIGTSMLSTSESLVGIVNVVDPAKLDPTMVAGAAVITGLSLVFCIVGAAISILVGNAAYVGIANYFTKNTNSKPSFKEAFAGFKPNYGRNIGTLLLMDIKLTLWSLLFIVPGVIKALEYSIIPFILADNADISCKEAFAKAKEMMKGNKWRLFKLNFSFIGWYLLCFLTFGIGIFFLSPYIYAANAEFYAELKNK